MQKNKKKNVVAVLAGVAVATAVAASAASLGGLTVQQLGADGASVISPLEDGLEVEWVISPHGKEYYVTGVELTPKGDESLPIGAEVAVSLFGPADTVVEFEGTVTNPDSIVIDAGLNSMNANHVNRISVVMVGGDTGIDG